MGRVLHRSLSCHVPLLQHPTSVQMLTQLFQAGEWQTACLFHIVEAGGVAKRFHM